MVWRYEFSEAQEREVLEAYLVQAVFSAECVYGKPRVRLEFGYLVDGSGKRCVLKATGEAGEAVARIFTGLLEKWVGEEAFTVRRVGDVPQKAVVGGEAG